MNRKYRSATLACVVMLMASIAPAAADRPDMDEAARIVEEVESRLAEAWESGVVDEVIALYDAEATAETEWGTVFKGHEALKRHFGGSISGTTSPVKRVSRATISSAISPDVIVTHGATFLIFGTGVTESMFHTRVLLRTEAGWKIAAEQLARPSTLPKDVVVSD